MYTVKEGLLQWLAYTIGAEHPNNGFLHAGEADNEYLLSP